MATDGKWIEGMSAEMKWADAAELILSTRLDTVENNWRFALEETFNPEAMHQMRVATRRARAAVRIFADILPKRVGNDLARLLKKLRNDFGPARDWDVFNIRLQEWSTNRPADEQPGLDFLSGMALGHRQLAQVEVESSIDRMESWRELRVQVKPRRGKRWRLSRQAPGLIATLLAEFQQSTECNLADPHNLHQVRISGKRLRYALELFVDVLGPQVRDHLLPKMEQVQDILGHANDANNLRRQIEIVTPYVPTLGDEPAKRFLIGINAWREQLSQDSAPGFPQFQAWLDQWRGSATIPATDIE